MSCPCPSIAAAQELYEADGSLEFLPPAEVGGDQDEDLGKVVSAWAALQVPAKVAALFVRGVTVRRALEIVVGLYEAAPPEGREAMEELLAFALVAATSRPLPQLADADDPPVSALETEWVRTDPAESPEVEGWYRELLDVYLPPPAAPSPSSPWELGQTTNGFPNAHMAQPNGASPHGAPAGDMAGTTAQPPNTASSSRRRYTALELADLASYCGLGEEPDEGWAAADLPRFWQDFEDARAKRASARQCLEEHQRLNYPRDRLNRMTLFTPQLVADMQALDFTGGDALISWDQRHKGLSPFALAPLSDNVDVSAYLDKYSAYEDTEALHRPGDRLAMASLAKGPGGDLPRSRDEFWKWVDHLATMYGLIFTDESPLARHLHALQLCLMEPRHYMNYGPTDWKVYLWVIHAAIREYFGTDHSVAPLRRVLNRLQIGELPNPREGAVELLPPPVSPSPEPPGGGRGGGGGGRQPRGDQGAGKRAARLDPWEPANAWKEAKDKARKALDAAGIQFRLKKLFPDTAKASFWGEDFIKAFGARNPRPCPYYFLNGTCNPDRTACDCDHHMQGQPPKDALDKLTAKVRARCEQVAKNPQLLKD